MSNSEKSETMLIERPLPEGGNDEEMAKNPMDADSNPKSPNKANEEKNGFFDKVGKIVAIVIPPGGILASAFNLASSSIGAGILGLPQATNSSGLVMALLYLIIITLVSIYSMYLLAIAAEKTQIRSFEASGEALLGRKFAFFVAAVRAFHSFSGCVAYVISVGNIISAIMDNSASAPDFLRGSVGNKLLTTLVWLVAMLPLVIPRHIDSLRYFSTFSVVFMIYFVIIIIVHSFSNGLPDNLNSISFGKDDNSNVILFNSGNKAIEGVGVFMFAYVCQITAYEIYWDMADRSIIRYTIASTLGMILCFLLYAAVSFFGYMDFGSSVDDSILLMYNPIKEPAIMVAYIGVLSKLCVVYGILSLACRNALYHCVGWNDPDAVVFWKHCIIVVCIAICILLSGLFIPKINIVLGFAGSITGGSLGFILPALFMMYSGGFTWKKVGAFNFICTYFMLLSGVVAVVFGTGATIYGTAVG